MNVFKSRSRIPTDNSSDFLDDVATQTPDLKAVEQSSPLLQLPPEVISNILTWLPCQSLVSLLRVCRLLRNAAQRDQLWSDLLRSHLPDEDFPPDPYPSSSYRDLYIAHHPYWWLAKHRIWISDDLHVGRLMLCKFDPRRGCIEGYRLLASKGPSTLLLWRHRPSVVIHSFKPRVHLWLDDPILRLPHEGSTLSTRQGWWSGEIKMKVGDPDHNTFASFFLSRNIPEHLQAKNMELWPPRTIPSMPRVRSASQDKFRGAGHKPQRYEDISTTTFRMRHWSQFNVALSHFGVRLGERVTTWSTLDPVLYTPTPKKPYQGIYVGDYGGHGCEFLLVMHTDRPPPLPQTENRDSYFRSALQDFSEDDLFNELMQEESSVAASASQAHLEEAGDDNGHGGALEAIKLTGDPNIPRGEHTFIADDIGARGLIRIANEQPFIGARVVKSRGHVAAHGFQNDEFIPSQLILVSHDRLAQYWVPLGHISFYDRINIDQLLSGTFARSCCE